MQDAANAAMEVTSEGGSTSEETASKMDEDDIYQ